MEFLNKIFKKKAEKQVIEPEKPEIRESSLVEEVESYDYSEKMRDLQKAQVNSRRVDIERRKIEKEIEKTIREIELEKAKASLAELKADLYGDDEEENQEVSFTGHPMADALIFKFLGGDINQITPGAAPTQPQPQEVAPEVPQAQLDDDILKKIIEKLPDSEKEHLKQIDTGSLIKIKSML